MPTGPIKVDNEVLVSLCLQCKCCLHKETNAHCWTCHSTFSIEAMCGCGVCMQKVADYQERELMRAKSRMSFPRTTKARAV